jgi:modulator of FtsH protease HflK
VVIAVLVFGVFGMTSYYTVGADSKGVVLRFEKFLKTADPGLHFKLPFGIDAVTILPIRCRF